MGWQVLAGRAAVSAGRGDRRRVPLLRERLDGRGEIVAAHAKLGERLVEELERRRPVVVEEHDVARRDSAPHASSWFAPGEVPDRRICLPTWRPSWLFGKAFAKRTTLMAKSRRRSLNCSAFRWLMALSGNGK